jgi:carboxylate-amine ligase
MPIDLNRTEQIFATSTDLTVGLEEEFAVLDPDTLDLVARFEELRDAGAEEPGLEEAITGELISSEIEIVSGRGEDIHDALAHQRERRKLLFALAATRGVALGSTGTHPWADYREQPNIDTEHYRRVVEGLGYVARRNNTFSLHVHVGVRDADRAVLACDRLRPVLPLLLAVSASSPFLEGNDTLLHSVRTQTFTKSFPRCGVPDAYGSWQAFRDYLELLIATNSIVEYTQVWWSVRPHATYGTIEVRIADAQITAAESDGLASLIVACVGQTLRDIDEGVPFDDPPPRLIEENMWRAIRHGMDGHMIDLRRSVEIPTRRAVEDLWTWTAPVRQELRIDPALQGPNGAQRQRAALLGGASLRDVYADTVRETTTTYAQEVPA